MKEEELPRSPSGGHVGPVVPSMKMKPMASLEGMPQQPRSAGVCVCVT